MRSAEIAGRALAAALVLGQPAGEASARPRLEPERTSCRHGERNTTANVGVIYRSHQRLMAILNTGNPTGAGYEFGTISTQLTGNACPDNAVAAFYEQHGAAVISEAKGAMIANTDHTKNPFPQAYFQFYLRNAPRPIVNSFYSQEAERLRAEIEAGTQPPRTE